MRAGVKKMTPPIGGGGGMDFFWNNPIYVSTEHHYFNYSIQLAKNSSHKLWPVKVYSNLKEERKPAKYTGSNSTNYRSMTQI